MNIDFKNPTPLYKQVASIIKSRINSGLLSEDEPIGSQQELALKYQVSLITIKKAIAELMAEGVLYSRVGKGTYVAGKPETASKPASNAIGVVLRDLKSPFFSLIVDSFEQHAYHSGFNILMSTSSGRLEKEESQIQSFRNMGLSGLIIASMSHVYRATPMIRKLHSENFPYVMVSYIEDQDIYYVGSDHEMGAFLATEHLCKLGYRKIGYINAENGNLLGDIRKAGYMKALHEYGKTLDERFQFRLQLEGGESNYQSGYEIGQLCATLDDKPDAMFIYNDLAALGFQKALLDHGLQVPDDIAIVGVDDIKRGRIAAVPLTTIHQPTSEIGILAADSLIKRIAGEHTEVRTILKPKLVIRESCGAKASVKSEKAEKEHAL